MEGEHEPGASVPLAADEIKKVSFTFITVGDEVSLGTRLRIAVSILLTPLTIIFIKRSIRVMVKPRRGYNEEQLRLQEPVGAEATQEQR